MRKAFIFSLCLILLASMIPTVSAEPTISVDITADTQFGGTGYGSFDFLADKNIDSYQTSSGNAAITLSNPQGIAGIYILFDLEYGCYTITDTASGQKITAGTHSILHEYVDLSAAFGFVPTEITSRWLEQLQKSSITRKRASTSATLRVLWASLPKPKA